MNDKITAIDEIKRAVRAVAAKRDWARFHSPKNLSMGLAIEAAELMEHFLWKSQSDSESPDDMKEVEGELADVFIFTLNLAARLGIDLAECTERKLKENNRKYPARLVKGKAHKYTHYEGKNDE